jgi:hypothetical protein
MTDLIIARSEVLVSGLICHIDVFPVPHPPQSIAALDENIDPQLQASSSTVAPVSLSQPSLETHQMPASDQRQTSLPENTRLDVVPVRIQPEDLTTTNPVIAFVNGLPLRQSMAITSQVIVSVMAFTVAMGSSSVAGCSSGRGASDCS